MPEVPGDSQKLQKKEMLLAGLKDAWLNITLPIFKEPHFLRPKGYDWRDIKRTLFLAKTPYLALPKVRSFS